MTGLVSASTCALTNTAINQTAIVPTTTTSVKQALTLKADSKMQLKADGIKTVDNEIKTNAIAVFID